jgi:hypothetical protein
MVDHHQKASKPRTPPESQRRIGLTGDSHYQTWGFSSTRLGSSLQRSIIKTASSKQKLAWRARPARGSILGLASPAPRMGVVRFTALVPSLRGQFRPRGPCAPQAQPEGALAP